MAVFPYFGDAVHAVLPFMKHGGDPAALTETRLHDVLMSHAPFNTYAVNMPPDFIGRTLECWRYIGELVAIADSAVFEPEHLGAKCPDLLLRHRNNLYLIEVKAYAKNKSWRHGKEQVQQGLAALQRLCPGPELYGYILHLTNHTTRPLEAHWYAVTPRNTLPRAA